MIQKNQMIIVGSLLLVFIIAVTTLFLLPNKHGLSLDSLNRNIDVGKIKIGMLEEEVIELWGTGEYIHGNGGYSRQYDEYGVQLNFPGDSDNDLYGRVGGLELTSSQYSVYNIEVGIEREQAIQQLLSHGFEQSDFSDNIFEQGEFMIGLHGETNIEVIQVWFADKDLSNRQS